MCQISSTNQTGCPAVMGRTGRLHDVVEVAMTRIAFVARARRQLRQSLLVVGVVALAATAAACSSSGGSSSSSSSPAGQGSASASGTVGGSLTVWVDAVRLPVAKAYATAHPNVHLNIVSFDGDSNGRSEEHTSE